MTSVQPIASRPPFALAALLALASCTGDGSKLGDAGKPVLAPDASQSMNTAGTSNMAGTVAVPPPVDSGAPEDAAEAEPEMDAASKMDASAPNQDDDDAGMWMPPNLECKNDEWLLAPGMLLAQPVDYVADRAALFDPTNGAIEPLRVISEAGKPCDTAKDRASCERALTVTPPNVTTRHLITTSGDTVKLWDSTSISPLFGLVDTPAEALWWLQTAGTYIARCNVVVKPAADGDGFTVENLLNPGLCGGRPPTDLEPRFYATVDVDTRGFMIQTQVAETWPDPLCNQMRINP